MRSELRHSTIMDQKEESKDESATGSDILLGGGADASAAVLTADCELVFVVTRGGRSTKGGATNALSKEIVKKLKNLPKDTPKTN